MEIPLQITSRNLELTDAIESEIRQKSEKLDRFYDRITRCRIIVESPHRHSHQGKLYNVNIYLTVPGAELVVKREPHEDLYVAIRDSFNAIRRKLEEYDRKQRNEVKHHEEAPQARITALFSDQGYGFLTTPDSREIYFHENSLLNSDFRKLKIGTKVRFSEAEGEKGPQASSVTII